MTNRLMPNASKDNYCIDHDKKVVWVRIPKTATTSIRLAWSKDLPKSELFSHHEYFTVAFVRNPYDRFISAWAGNWRRKTSPEDLMSQIEQTKPNRLNKHYRPQHLFTDGKRIDFLGRFETLYNDWNELTKIRPDLNLRPLTKQMGSYHKDWHDLSQELKDRIREYYSKDFEQFGYREVNSGTKSKQ